LCCFKYIEATLATPAIIDTVIEGLLIYSAITGLKTDESLATTLVTANIAPLKRVGK
jgi:hypothetical protein